MTHNGVASLEQSTNSSPAACALLWTICGALKASFNRRQYTKTMTTPELTELRLERKRRVLVCEFADGQTFELDCEYLRTHSPSAEVRGHGLSEPKLLTGKQDVNIEAIEPIGTYAVALRFDDGHNTGIYSWDFLYRLGRDMQHNKSRYRQRLADAGLPVE